jgi:transcriptional regulator of acetoin/glycerol metabolism
VIAATHRDLTGAVAAGTFRADLYARLAAWVIDVPPLRARRDDILDLARGVLDRRPGRPKLSSRAAEALLLHDWPFNVRELEHAVDAAAVRATDGAIRCQYLPPPIAARVLGSGAEPVRDARAEDLEARSIAAPTEDELRRLVAEHHGNVRNLARALGKDRQQIYRWLKRHGIDVAAARDEHRSG